MQETTRLRRLVRFGEYELDTRAGDLHQGEVTLQLHTQPLQVLLLLLEHQGELVTRDELRAALWPDYTFVDFEDGLNHAIRRLRAALGDSAENPRFIETLPRRGYRFIHPIQLAPSFSPDRVSKARLRRYGLISLLAGAVAAALILTFLNATGLLRRFRTANSLKSLATPPRIESIAVLPFENLSGDPAQEYFADGMTEELVTDLGKISPLRVISRTSAVKRVGPMRADSRFYVFADLPVRATGSLALELPTCHFTTLHFHQPRAIRSRESLPHAVHPRRALQGLIIRLVFNLVSRFRAAVSHPS